MHREAEITGRRTRFAVAPAACEPDEAGEETDSVREVKDGEDSGQEKSLRESRPARGRGRGKEARKNVGASRAQEADPSCRGKERSNCQKKQCRHEEGWNELSRSHLPRVFLEDANLEEPVLKVLAKE